MINLIESEKELIEDLNCDELCAIKPKRTKKKVDEHRYPKER